MRKLFQRVTNYLAEAWQPVVAFTAFAVGLLTLFGWRLLTMPDGYSQVEADHADSVLKFTDLIANPISAPVTALQYVLNKLPFIDPGLALRGGSVIIAVVSIIGFYLLIRMWLGRRSAIFGTILFATSSTTLLMSRLGTDLSGFLLVPLFLLLGLHLKNVKPGGFPVVPAVLFAGMLYLPGFVWLLLAGAVWQRKQLKHSMQRVFLSSKLLASIAAAVFAAPLIYVIVRDPSVALGILGLPEDLPSLTDVGSNFVSAISGFFILGDNNPVYGLGRLPAFDIATTVLFVLGAIHYIKNWRLDRVRMVFVCMIILLVLASLGGTVSPLALTGLLYIIVASGIAYLLNVWLSVFPRNPLANIFATAVLAAFIGFIAFYHTNRYFVAWMNTPETVEAFDHKNLLQ